MERKHIFWAIGIGIVVFIILISYFPVVIYFLIGMGIVALIFLIPERKRTTHEQMAYERRRGELEAERDFGIKHNPSEHNPSPYRRRTIYDKLPRGLSIEQMLGIRKKR
ncbi:MAG: hypothetical protein V1702_04485 [Candidatus Woesearchaeota archaeon]